MVKANYIDNNKKNWNLKNVRKLESQKVEQKLNRKKIWKAKIQEHSHKSEKTH